MSDFKKNFGIRVKHYRTQIGYSQEKLAEKVGITAHTVGYIERGKNTISFSKLPALCAALNIEPYQLFIDTNNIETPNDKILKINEILTLVSDKQLNIIYEITKNIFDLNN